jgi:protein required for attachment to host cells
MTTTVRLVHLATVLVCDGRKALFLKNRGDAELPDLRLEESLEAPPNPRAHEQGDDRPGRMSFGGRRSAMEETDWHVKAESDFAGQVAGHLNRRHSDEPFTALIIAAPPRFLGDLRRHFSPAVADSITAEIAKDLVNLPIAELERTLSLQ